jgi:hypothetical protein
VSLAGLQSHGPVVRVEAVLDAPVAVAHDEDVDDAPPLLFEQRLVARLVQLEHVLAGGDALVSESDAGRECLLLPCDEAGAGARADSPVEVLHADSGDEQQRHDQQQPRAETVEKFWQSHTSEGAPGRRERCWESFRQRRQAFSKR